MKRKIIFATGNQGKLAEVKEILKSLHVEVLSLRDISFEKVIEETGATFEENAIIKAKTIMDIANEVVLADDSGLEIDFLNKEPGVYSARYLGEDTSYDIKNNTILERLKGVPDDKRTARFVCAIAAAFPNGEIITTSGTIEGIIGHEIIGDHGFGYDPIFYLPDYGCSTAQLSMEMKNKISHRGRALEKMKEELEKRGF